MRILNLDDRLSLAVGDGAADVERASAGRFGADVMAIYPRWAEFSEWARSYTGPADQTLDDSRLGPAGTEEWMAFVRDSEDNLVGLVSRHAPDAAA